jgi:ribosomal protein S18 acetylase RimI-like enzyme
MEDGRAVCFRPLNANDAPLIEAGISALSDRSRYLRFFSGFKHAPKAVLDLLTNFDDDHHLAWGAVDMSLDHKPAVAAAHIIRTDSLPNNRGDFAVAVLDDYHNQGIARAITYHLFSEAVSHGFTHVELDVLIENRIATSMFKWLGGKSLKSHGNIVHMEIEIGQALTILNP